MIDLPAAILARVAARGPDKSVCPSEVARATWPDNWRGHMDEVRAAARVLAKAGRIRVTQGDADLHPDEPWVGPVRLRSIGGGAA